MRTVRQFVDDPSAKYGFRSLPATYEDAEKITGFRLDQRSGFLITRNDEVEQEAQCTVKSSGCSCDCSSCSNGYNAHKASRFQECGGTGKRRMYFDLLPSPPKRKAS